MGERKNNNIEVFSDFDGTITYKDLGDEIFREFGEFEPYHSQLIDGKLKIADYWKKVCSTLRVGEHEIRNYAGEQEIDPYFAKFTELCHEMNIPINIISDGFDVYITTVLEKAGITDVGLSCNRMIFGRDGTPEPLFPLASESCNCLCASCKRNAMLNKTDIDTVIVFIGDGYSDYCAAEHSDLIFAKGALAAYCNANKIPHYPYRSFADVIRIFKNILPQRLKQRNQSRLMRKKAFETE